MTLRAERSAPVSVGALCLFARVRSTYFAVACASLSVRCQNEGPGERTVHVASQGRPVENDDRLEAGQFGLLPTYTLCIDV